MSLPAALSAAMFHVCVAVPILNDIMRQEDVDPGTPLRSRGRISRHGLLLGLPVSGHRDPHPGSFSGLDVEGDSAHFRFGSLIYFSFVTLATVGHGDIVPVAPGARMSTIVEAIAGQLYVAVLIARLVSKYSANRPAKGSP